MSRNQQRQPLQTQQLRKRYQSHRRRQLAGFLLVGGIILGGLLVFAIVWVLVNGFSRMGDGALRTKVDELRGEDSLPEVALDLRLNPAPYFCTVSTTRAFFASDTSGAEPTYPGQHISRVAAYSLDGNGELLWDNELDVECAAFAAADESIVLFGYSQTPPFNLRLEGLDQANGKSVWLQLVEDAISPHFTVSGKVAVVSYWQQDGAYRVVGFNAASGVKAWGYRLPMSDQLAEYDFSAGAPRLNLLASADMVCFFLGASIGFIDSGSGRLLRQQAVPEDISQLTIDWDNKSCLIIGDTDPSGKSTLYRMPIYEGIPVPLHEFTVDEGAPLILHYSGNTVLAYNGRPTESLPDESDIQEPACRILYFPKGQTTPATATTFPRGVPTAGAGFPGGESGAVLALSDSVDEVGQPQGRTTLARLDPSTGSADRQGQVGQVIAMLPFRQDVVMLVKGGDVRVYAEPVDDHLRVASLTGQFSDWRYCSGNSALLITSGAGTGTLNTVVLK